jgi:hypothetical protein
VEESNGTYTAILQLSEDEQYILDQEQDSLSNRTLLSRSHQRKFREIVQKQCLQARLQRLAHKKEVEEGEDEEKKKQLLLEEYVPTKQRRIIVTDINYSTVFPLGDTQNVFAFIRNLYELECQVYFLFCNFCFGSMSYDHRLILFRNGTGLLQEINGRLEDPIPS